MHAPTPVTIYIYACTNNSCGFYHLTFNHVYHYGFGQQISHDTYLTIIPLRSMEYSEQIFQWLWARQLDHMASCEQIISYLKLHNKQRHCSPTVK